ncbi:hypothetical protein GXW83_32815 [Streptacidiphilus sp. PB12-B1b]|uniref:DUF5819 family protein n=1 Tax=Streptacidiphilus sp. PB12-B1b TaxID=2705012 RepID=UPI0015FD83DC|nr:DUF5819 family protein [Streptacidiphilus sp. PB12-B1b]QMU79772.1 hypothetical protein GXW83_32815 [Streptacidiphilus sp. PB12-B1b]
MAEQPSTAATPDHSIPDPDPDPESSASASASAPAPATDPDADPEAPAGPRRWSRGALAVLGTAAAVLLCATAWHLAAVFLSIAPANTLSTRYQHQIDGYVYPEFEQNWQLFAPNPLQENIAVEVRVQTLAPDGSSPQSGWINLTAQDIARVRDNPAPSHADQNLLRRAWDYYTSWHNQNTGASLGSGGPLSVEYLKRIALQRIGRDWRGEPIAEVQFRSATTPVVGPAWTGAPAKATTSYLTLPWWLVTDADDQGLAR